ncbi:MAG: flagellar hook-basal body complex protein FliE [Phycisphaerae bacterium]
MTDPTGIPGIQSGVAAPQGPAGPPASPAGRGASAPVGRDFKSILVDSLEEVNRLQTEADQGVQRLLTGEADNVIEVFHAVNKAEIAFDMLMEVRNKLVEAYGEIQQIRV